MTRFTWTRREFVQTGVVLASTITSVPGFLQQSALAMAPQAGKPGTPDDRILVVVQLSGGNDGLNTIVPFQDDAYYRARPLLAVKKTDVHKLDGKSDVALHPSLEGFKSLYDDGMLGIVQGVGYPNPNRSHFASMDIWHSADLNGGHGTGWVGRAMDHVTGGDTSGDAATCTVCVGREAPMAAEGKHIKPIAFERANAFRWSGSDLHPALEKQYDTFNRSGPLAEIPADSQAAFVMRTAMDAQIASDKVRAAVAKGNLTTFPRNELAQQLQMVASMIRAELPTRVYYVALGGFDTHAGQLNRHGNLMRTFASAMDAFYKELKAMGQADRVLSIAFSEFGRRVSQNASQGTDHGCAGPMFTFGPMVKPGILGDQPSLTKLDSGDLVYHTDFRSVYAAVLDQWMKADSKTVLQGAFKHAEILRA